MDVDIRLRLSLIGRMLFALAVLTSISVPILVLAGLAAVAIGLYAGGFVISGVETIATAPRVSTVVPVPAYFVAIIAGFGVVSVVRAWPYVAGHTSARWLVQRDNPVSLFALGVTLGCLYLVVVEGSATLAVVLSTRSGSLVALSGFVVLLVVVYVLEIRREVRKLGRKLVADSEPADEVFPDLVGIARRLAQLADVPPPTVRVTTTDRPESYTVGSGDSAIVVVSSGTVEVLSRDELEAVVAHEVSHLANGDSRIMGAALTPVSIIDDWMFDDPSHLQGVLRNAFYLPLKWYAQFGVAVLSRGREWAADAGAVALTGSPAPLASALASHSLPVSVAVGRADAHDVALARLSSRRSSNPLPGEPPVPLFGSHQPPAVGELVVGTVPCHLSSPRSSGVRAPVCT